MPSRIVKLPEFNSARERERERKRERERERERVYDNKPSKSESPQSYGLVSASFLPH